MNLKDKVLNCLEENRDSYLSGEELAALFGVSRAAVWKAVRKLQEDGCGIIATPGKGYRLSSGSDILSASGISRLLGEGWEERIIVRKEVDSTNNLAKELALRGAPHGTVVVAEKQTAGRGRLGRTFESPEGAGLYLTIIMRPDADMQKALLITTAAAVGVCRAISSLTGTEAGIKWVNDVYIGEKKVCGILTEAVTDFESGSLESVVAGIGINFRTPEEGFSDEVMNRGVCSLFESGEPTITRNQLAAQVIKEVLAICENLDDKSFLQEYRQRSIVLGREVTLIRGDEKKRARALDISENGGLIVLTSDGEQKELTSGEISVRW